MTATTSRKQTWLATKHSHIFQLEPSGIYYVRVKPKGRPQVRESLKTDNWTEAKRKGIARLAELGIEPKAAQAGTWGALVEPWLEWVNQQVVLKSIGGRTPFYKRSLLLNIRKTWPDWDRFKLPDLTEKRLANWLVDHRKVYSATRTNGAVTVLREMLLEVAVKDRILSREFADEVLHGLKFVSVDYDYKRMTLELPEPPQVLALRNEVYGRCKLKGTLGGYLFDGLLFSGMRIDSARAMLRSDVHRTKALVYVREAKYGPYEFPLYPDFLELVDRIEKNIPGGPQDKLFPTTSLQTVLTSACKHLKLPHLSHQGSEAYFRDALH